MTAVARSLTKLWIVAGDTDASSLDRVNPYSSSNTSGYIAGEIKSYSKSGGDTDVESDAVFGGYVDKEKPQSQIEVSFDIVPSLENGNLWESLSYASQSIGGRTVFVSGGTVSDRAIFIEATNGTNAVGFGYNNANVTVLDMEHNADDNQTKTLNLKLSPTTSGGIPNFISCSTSTSSTFEDINDLPSWAQLSAE